MTGLGWIPHRLVGSLAGVLIGTLLGVLGFRGANPLRLEPARTELRVGTAGVRVAVSFPEGSVEPATFRARLNGADVTPLLMVAGNGASGRHNSITPRSAARPGISSASRGRPTKEAK